MGQELREELADYAHIAWSGWMRYLFDKCDRDINGCLVISRENHMRWVRQVNTAYMDLPENEKESDRKEADRMIAIMEAHKQTTPIADMHTDTD